MKNKITQFGLSFAKMKRKPLTEQRHSLTEHVFRKRDNDKKYQRKIITMVFVPREDPYQPGASTQSDQSHTWKQMPYGAAQIENDHIEISSPLWCFDMCCRRYLFSVYFLLHLVQDNFLSLLRLL